MKKCEIEQKLLDATPEELAEISDFFAARLGKTKPPDPVVDTLDQAAQGWIEKDGRFECKDTCKGRLCMRKDIQDKVVEKKPDTSVEDLLTPDALKEKTDDPNFAPDSLGLTPDALRDIISTPGLAKSLVTGQPMAKEKVDAADLVPDNLK
jgi:hypothetical protein